jgi:hypothetical protein
MISIHIDESFFFWPSGWSQSTAKKRGPTKKLGDHEKYPIFELDEDGTPLAPEENVKKFIRQCGVIVRDTIPITIREWNKPKQEEVSFVSERDKNDLWVVVLQHFNLPPPPT